MATTTRGKTNKKIELTEAKTVLNTVKDFDPAKVVTEVGNLQVSLQSTLANLSAQITDKIQKMQMIDTAINLKEERLQELYNIEKEAISLDDIKAQKDAEIADWNKQKIERDAEWLEEENDHSKLRDRQHDDWHYQFEHKKMRMEEENTAVVDRNKRAELVRQETLVKSWTDREAVLKAREVEFANMQKQVEEFDTRLKSEVAKAEAIATASVKRQYEHEKQLLAKDAEATKNMYEMRVASMGSTIDGLQNQIKEVQVQLVAARSDAKEIASSALASAADKKVAEALARVVDQREPNNKK